MEKKLQDKIALIEKREPIVSVLQEKGVKAAYDESLKRKREEEEERVVKRKKAEEVNATSMCWHNDINFEKCKYVCFCLKEITNIEEAKGRIAYLEAALQKKREDLAKEV